MNKQELKLLAQKYLAGNCSEEEKNLLNNWYDTSYDEADEHVTTDFPETEEETGKRIFQALQMDMHGVDAATPQEQTSRTWSLWLRYAGVAAAIGVIFFAWQFFSYRETALPKTVLVPQKKVILVTLPDGSRVWLNAGSVFKYPKKFNADRRIVELVEGRAYFEIKHRDKHPFIVHTEKLNVTVLGTSFDVQAYQKNGMTKVSVVTGKVGITMKNDPKTPAVMLLPKQEVVLHNIDRKLIKAPVHEIAVNVWCKSQLVFEQENLSNVFKVLEHKYNKKIAVADKDLLKERISITLSNQHLDSVMTILSFTKHFKYQIANDSIKVTR